MLDVLQKQRRELERDLGHRQLGVATCEVLDELIRQLRTMGRQVPANAPMTRSFLENQFSEMWDLLKSVSATLEKTADLMEEGEDVVYERRQPFIRLIRRIESEGYAVDTETFTTVTDARDWSVLDTIDDPAVHVQVTADRIARAEQAALYQQRLQRMDAAINKIETDYVQQIRACIHEDR